MSMCRRSGHEGRVTPIVAATVCLFSLVGVSEASLAQEKLLGTHAIGGGAYFESVVFGGDGVRQVAFAGMDTVRVRRATQLLLPVTVATPLGGGWRLDVTAFHARGTVTYAEGDRGGAERTGTLSGLSDVRLRASGHVLRESITLTVGANLPTGTSSLSSTELSTLRVLAAPGLAMGSSPVGAGFSGTFGAVYGREAGPWSLAMGASYEYRGRYQPVAALIAGAPSADFRPGAVVRTSIGADRLVGAHRLRLVAAADVFSDDKLRGSAQEAESGEVLPTLATVRLGPVFSGDAQLHLAARRFRDLILYSSYLWRAAYARDGRTAAGSSGQYLAGGVRAALPLTMTSDVIMAGEGRWHSGLGVDEGMPTAGVRSASLTLGIDGRRGLLSLQPYVRAQAGQLHQRGSGDDVRPSFVGLAGGLVLVSRF
ncbi:MAG: hypothetical protein IPP20_18410 [Gemmatimonadetes bacterium]|nr:hypothetical protein [Gemmatimonadota bacterium]